MPKGSVGRPRTVAPPAAASSSSYNGRSSSSSSSSSSGAGSGRAYARGGARGRSVAARPVNEVKVSSRRAAATYGADDDDDDEEEEEDGDYEAGAYDEEDLEEDEEQAREPGDWDEDGVELDDELGELDDLLGIEEEDFWENHSFPKQGARRGRPPRSDRDRTFSYPVYRGSSSASNSARRSRRMKPLDGFKELIVLMPGDDPVEKLGLAESELPEFVCCMEEPCVWEEPESAQDKEHGGHKEISLPDGFQVIVPDVSVALDPADSGGSKGGVSRQGSGKDRLKKGAVVSGSAAPAKPEADFVLCRPGESSAGATYTAYELESEDEDFLASLRAPESKASKGGAAKGGGSRNGAKLASSSLDPKLVAGFESEHLCTMLAALEREFELARIMAPGQEETETARARCEDCNDVAFRILEVLEAPNASALSALDKLERLQREAEEKARSESLGMVRTGYMSSPRSHDEADINDLGNDRPHMNEQEIPRFSLEQVEALLPLDKAMPVMLRVHAAAQVAAEKSDGSSAESGGNSSSSSSSSNSSSSSSSSSGGGGGGGVRGKSLSESAEGRLLQRVYSYWAQKRGGRKASLLRCYHTFIMENWSQQDELPMLPEDADTPGLLAAHEKLVRLRRDLDRARLIMDRVRRREKLKRELVRTAGDALTSYLEEVPVAEDSAEESPRPTSSSPSSSRQPRAAKALAVEKLSKGPTSADGRDGGLPDFDEYVLPFSLEEIDYDALEVPVLPSPTQVGMGGVGHYRRDSIDEYGNYDDRGHRGSTRSRRYAPLASPMGNSSATGWTADEDHLLLLGVAACGVGRWTEIREDFLLARNSAQMNQRFTRLARRRCMLVKITGNTSAAAAKRAALKADDSDDDDGEYTEVRTAYMTQQEIVAARSKLPPILREMLEKYTEDGVWESIALRHLFDTQSKEKRCGRPQKYPLPIPIPKHLQNGGWQSRKRNLVQRPSAIVPGWLPGGGGGYGVRVGSFQPLSQSHGAHGGLRAQSTYAPAPPARPRGRPRKFARVEEEEQEADDEDVVAEANALSAQRRKEEQDNMREERAKARAVVLADRVARNTSKKDAASAGSSPAPPRCSLGSLQAPSSGGGRNLSEADASLLVKRGRGRPPKRKDDDDDDGDGEGAPRKSTRNQA